MIYTLHELQHAASAPLRLLAETSQQLFTNPFSPLAYLPHSSRVAAGSELLARVARRYEKPEFGLGHTVIDGETVAIHEEIVAEKPFCRLLRFKRATTLDHPKVLLVAPLSGHYATLLRDTVRALLPDHDVYITDWIDARLVPLADGYFHFADYVAYMQEFIRKLGPDVHVISVCQPTVPVMAAISLMAAADDPAQPRSMTLMGGPIDTRAGADRGQPLRQDAQPALVRHARHHARAAQVSRLHAPRLSGLPAARRLRRHEFRPPPAGACRFLQSPGRRRRRFGRGAPQVLRRVQRGDGPAGRVLPGNARHGVHEARSCRWAR